MHATGLPPHILHGAEVALLRDKVDALKSLVESNAEALPNAVGKVVTDDIRGWCYHMIIILYYCTILYDI